MPEKVMVENLLQAIPLVSAALKLKLNENVHEVRLTNEGKHLLMKTNVENYWVLYKRETFHSFGIIFGIKGQEGESINRDIFELARNQNVKNFIFVYQNGEVFIVLAEEIIDYIQKFNTVRQQDITGEVTYSFSTGIMRRIL